MRSIVVTVVACCVLAIAPAAGASTWQIGPSIGLDAYSSSGGGSLATVSAPVGSDIFTGGLRPGLRVGAWDPSFHHEWFVDSSFLLLSNSGSTAYTASNTLNYAYAFRRGSAPYVTGGAGFAHFSSEGSSQTFWLYGVGLGHRQRLRHGHGSVRTEFRFDRISDSDATSNDINVLAVRIGFDLDLN